MRFAENREFTASRYRRQSGTDDARSGDERSAQIDIAELPAVAHFNDGQSDDAEDTDNTVAVSQAAGPQEHSGSDSGHNSQETDHADGSGTFAEAVQGSGENFGYWQGFEHNFTSNKFG